MQKTLVQIRGNQHNLLPFTGYSLYFFKKCRPRCNRFDLLAMRTTIQDLKLTHCQCAVLIITNVCIHRLWMTNSPHIPFSQYIRIETCLDSTAPFYCITLAISQIQYKNRTHLFLMQGTYCKHIVGHDDTWNCHQEMTE